MHCVNSESEQTFTHVLCFSSLADRSYSVSMPFPIFLVSFLALFPKYSELGMSFIPTAHVVCSSYCSISGRCCISLFLCQIFFFFQVGFVLGAESADCLVRSVSVWGKVDDEFLGYFYFGFCLFPFFLVFYNNWGFLVFLSLLSCYIKITFSENHPRSHEETVTSLLLLFVGTHRRTKSTAIMSVQHRISEIAGFVFSC